MNSICPEYIKTFETVMNGHVGYYYNMFISTRRTLERYCEWLFQILFEVERLKEADDEQRKSADAEGSTAEAKKADSSNTTYQDRLYGFLSERLLQVWVVHNGLTIKEYPVFNTEEPPVGFAKRNAIRIKYLWAKYVTHKDTEYIHKELN